MFLHDKAAQGTKKARVTENKKKRKKATRSEHS
jgi:hypothetical protein